MPASNSVLFTFFLQSLRLVPRRSMAQGIKTVAMTTMLCNISCPAYIYRPVPEKGKKTPVLEGLCPAPT